MTEERSGAQAQTLPGSSSSSEPVAGGPPDDNNPFPGPKSYRRDQKELFFGRGSEIEKLTSLVVSTSAVLLYANSGSGKSSLLQAGLVPSLLESFDYLILPTVRFDQVGQRSPGDGADISQPNPFAQLLCGTVLAEDDKAPDTHNLKQLTDYLHKRDGGKSTLLILDQLEELFDYEALWRERAAFLVQLRRALETNPWLHAVLAIRSDYLANLVPHERELPGRMLVRCGLESLREQAAREAIEKAFKSTDVRLVDTEIDLVLDRLLNLDVGQDGPPVRGQYVNLILLQILCRRLWQEKAKSRSGSVADASDGSQVLQGSQVDLTEYLRSFVDDAVADVVSQTQTDEGVVRRWLEALITPAGRRDFHLLDNDQAAGLPKGVLDALEDARLIQLEQRNQSRYVELTHDSMVTAVQASNDRWVGARLRRRRWLTAVFAVVLLGLLALFPLLRNPADESLLANVGGTVKGLSSVPFPPAPNGDVAVVHVSLAGEIFAGTAVDVVASGQGKKSAELAHAFVPATNGAAESAVSLVVETTQKASYAVLVHTPGFLEYHVTVHSAQEIPSPLVPGPGFFIKARSPLVAVKLNPDQPLYLGILGGLIQSVSDAQVLTTNGPTEAAVVESPGREGYAVLSIDAANQVGPEVIGRVVEQEPGLRFGTQAHIRATYAAISPVHVQSADAPFAVDASCRNNSDASLELIGGAGRSAASPAESVPAESVLMPGAYGNDYRLLLISTSQTDVNCRVTMRSFAPQRITTTGKRSVEVYANTRFNAYPIRLPSDAAIIVTDLNGARASLDCLSNAITESGSERLLAFVPGNHDCVLSIERSVGTIGKPVSFPLLIVPISGR
ncbi:MAG TPA: ATP-binding protein [Streptosporangiaceae bacterium]|nr:ATP-binding protein [Streptosporangiaceae bacterium]